MFEILTRKVRSARIRLNHAREHWRQRQAASRKERAVDLWIESLKSNPPEVLVGANFALYGGVREHLRGIVRHSSLEVELAPPDALLATVGAHDIANTFQHRFFDFSPNQLRAVHSHVYPWYINWCRHHQGHGATWIHTYHLPYFPEHARGELQPWQKEFNSALVNDARHADVKLSVAKWQRKYLRDLHGIDTIYLPNGVDLKAAEAASASRFANPFGTGPFVLYVGRNDPVKNPVAFVDLATKLPHLQFVMAGNDLSAASLQHVWNVDIPTNLRFIGALSHDGVLDAIAASSLLVVTSYREGLPTLVLEGMSLEKRIVVPDEQGCMEAVGHGEFAWVYKLESIDDLVAQTLEAFSADQAKKGGRDRVASEYDWRVVSPKLDDIYRGSNP